MPTTRIIEPHGAEHYHQLLEWSEEDDTSKSQCSKVILKTIRIVRRSGDKYVVVPFQFELPGSFSRLINLGSCEF